MIKWAMLALLIGIAAGGGLWLAVDPQARWAALDTWQAATAWVAGGRIEIHATSLVEPITKALREFGDSVARLWSPGAIQIQVPHIQPGK